MLFPRHRRDPDLIPQLPRRIARQDVLYAQLVGFLAQLHDRRQPLTAQLQVDLPVYKNLGMGSQLNFFRRHSRFESFPAVTKDTWQLRIFLSLH